MTTADKFAALKDVATRLRINSVKSTTEAGSGHPSSCCSAADIVAALFFGGMKFDPKNPHNPNADRFVLSKGHAAPLLYSAWVEVGHVSVEELMKLRTFGCNLEGHPTPRLDFVDVATGSLGQGLERGRRHGVRRPHRQTRLSHVGIDRRRRKRGRFDLGSR